MTKFEQALEYGFKKFTTESNLLNELKQQFTTAWIVFEYSEEETNQIIQSFALVTLIIDDMSVSRDKTFITYDAMDVLSDCFVEFDETNDKILCYQVLEGGKILEEYPKFIPWNRDVDLNQLIIFKVLILNNKEAIDTVCIGRVDIINNIESFEIYTAHLTPLVDINDYPESVKEFAKIPFIGYQE